MSFNVERASKAIIRNLLALAVTAAVVVWVFTALFSG
jgi:hypothetical protein